MRRFVGDSLRALANLIDPPHPYMCRRIICGRISREEFVRDLIKRAQS